MANDYKNVQTAVEELLNTKTVIRRKKKSEQNKKKELFVQTINNIETGIIRTTIAFADFGIDYSTYDEVYHIAIDSLIMIAFGKDAAELIGFYLWDRVNPDGSINPVLDEDDNEIILKDVHELWDLLCKLNPQL